MRDGWRELMLGDAVLMVRRGKAPSYIEAGGMLVLNQKCIRSENLSILTPARRTNTDRKRVEPDLVVRDSDVLVCSTGRGTLGRASIAPRSPEPYTVDGHVTIVRADDRILSGHYLALLLSTDFARLESLASGSTNQTELSPAALRALTYSLPPMCEQRRIVDLVRALDDAIQKASVAQNAIARLGLALTANMPGNPVQLGYLLDRIDAGRSPSGEDRLPAPDERAVLKVSAIGASGFVPTEVKVVGTNEYLAPKSVISDGDVLMVRANGVLSRVGVVARVRGNFPNLFLCDKTLRLVPREARLDGRWLAAALASQAARRQIEAITGGSHMRNITQQSIMQVEIPAPSIEDQMPYAAAFDAVDDARERAGAEIESLSRLRSNLLTALLSGEHEIPESYDALLDRAEAVA